MIGRFVLGGCVLLLVAVLATKHFRGPALNANATAALLAKRYRLHQVTGIYCGAGQRGWDYVCTYHDIAKDKDMNIGVHVFKTFYVHDDFRVSAPVPLGKPVPPKP
jgi:hypothetical protein